MKNHIALTLLAAASLFVASAQAQQPPYALFQRSTLTGSGNTVTATQVPVVTAGGAITYVNVTMQFSVDFDGTLTVSQGFPQVSPAPNLISGNFRAGRYVGPGNVLNGKAAIIVSGPGVTDGGATQWSLSAAPGADPSTFPASATWYAGPLENNPYGSRVTKAGITSTAYSYGVLGSGNYGNWWRGGYLLGFSQTGNSLTIVSFGAGTENSTPGDQITYTWVGSQ